MLLGAGSSGHGWVSRGSKARGAWALISSPMTLLLAGSSCPFIHFLLPEGTGGHF